MSEVGRATELRFATSSVRLNDWGEGKKIIEDLNIQIDIEIGKIRADGRISPVVKPTYVFGHVAQPNFSGAITSQAIEVSAAKKRGSGGKWILRIVAAFGLIWLLSSEEGRKFIYNLFRTFNVETDIEKYDCEKVASLVRGETLQNNFGARFEIIAISSLNQISKTSERIVCSASVSLSNATTQRMRLTVEKGPSTSEILYRIEPL